MTSMLRRWWAATGDPDRLHPASAFYALVYALVATLFIVLGTIAISGGNWPGGLWLLFMATVAVWLVLMHYLDAIGRRG